MSAARAHTGFNELDTTFHLQRPYGFADVVE
jgi:hypothetical protein